MDSIGIFYAQSWAFSSHAIAMLGTAVWWCVRSIIVSPPQKCNCEADLTGKVAIVTGGTDGVGKVTAKDLAKRNATIILPCRNLEKGQKVAEELRKFTNGGIFVFYAEFTDLSSVGKCASAIIKHFNHIDILVNNAGIGHGIGITKDGNPSLFGINHLASFLLTTRLLPLLRNADSARIIFVTSIAHLWGNIDFFNLNKEDGSSVVSQFNAYAESKLSNVLFAKKLARDERSNNITTYNAHPGWCFTALFRDFPFLLKVCAFPLFYFFLYTPEEGAQTQIHLCVTPNIEKQSGGYFVNCSLTPSCARAHDCDLADKLWDYSEKAVAKHAHGFQAVVEKYHQGQVQAMGERSRA